MMDCLILSGLGNKRKNNRYSGKYGKIQIEQAVCWQNAMTEKSQQANASTDNQARKVQLVYEKAPAPLPNYTLSTVCPACEHETFKLACKVRCPRCGFVWDCSEL